MKAIWLIWMFLFLTTGKIIAQEITVAQKHYEELKLQAEKGDAFAQNNLGVCYYKGDGVLRNPTEAVKWYRKAAEQNDAEAELNLGLCYANGDGITNDFSEAVKWYRKAADSGNAIAQFKLFSCYYKGDGVTQDLTVAVKWLRKSAEQGNAISQYNLGACYFLGRGVKKDEIEAVKFYRKVAEQGLACAQYALGSCYANGEGVPKDYVEAYKWIDLALAQGNEDAKQNLSAVEQMMTPVQIAEAQQLAREYRPKVEYVPDKFPSSNIPMDSGSGFFITDDGYLISNYHVVKEATKVCLVTSAGTIDAKVVQVDAANDLALLKADGKFSPLPIAASRTAHLGGTVVTIGFPDTLLQGFSPKLAKGEIASLSGAGDDPRYFQISAPVQPGNSGGALVDDRGNVIGIVSAKLDAAVALAASGALPENVNYAVKSSLLLSFLESVPDVSVKLKEPNTKDESFGEVVKSAQDAAVLVLVY